MNQIKCVTDGKKYCEELYNDEENRQIDVQEKEQPPLKDEIRRALLKSAQLKATGPEGIAAELLRFDGEITLNKLNKVYVEVWETVLWPDEWTQSVFIPLPNKGDPFQCCNYRTIALVSHTSKILVRMILDHMQLQL